MKLRKFIREIILECLNYKSIIKEYITNDEIYLRDYLSMSEESKKQSLPYDFYYFFDEFISETEYDFEYPEELNQEIGEDSEGLMSWLEENDKETFDAFAEYLYDRIKYSNLPIPESEYPAWSYFDDSPVLVKNQWLIHFTNNADDIAREGFKYGVDDMTKLGLTTHLGEFDKKFGGYNFAYTLNDFQKYGHNRRGYKYGKEAVVFNASGIKVWHHGDEEPQVIFYGNTARNIIPITEGESENFAIFSKNGRVLFENDDLSKVVEWLVKNYQQYRKAF